MRAFLILAILIGLGALYLWQKHNEAPPTPAPQQTISEHDWMKRSLDRASEVAKKARAQTQEAQDP
jgi:hypothetical protein